MGCDCEEMSQRARSDAEGVNEELRQSVIFPIVHYSMSIKTFELQRPSKFHTMLALNRDVYSVHMLSSI